MPGTQSVPEMYQLLVFSKSILSPALCWVLDVHSGGKGKYGPFCHAAGTLSDLQ